MTESLSHLQRPASHSLRNKALRIVLASAQFAAVLGGAVVSVFQPVALAPVTGAPHVAEAAAGDGDFVLDSKIPSVTTTPSGQEFTYKINFTCSATLAADTCVNVVVTDTLDSNLANTIGSVFADGPGALLHPTIAPQVDLVNRLVTWTLKSSIEGGSTGELTLRVRAPNGTTPNGTVITNTAAGTTSRGPITARFASAPVIITASDKMNAIKSIGIPTSTLPLDDPVPFRIRLCPTDSGPGGLNATNVSYVESLPAGATYVPGSGKPAPTSVTSSTIMWDTTAWPTSTVQYNACRTVKFKLAFPSGTFNQGETYTNTGYVNYTPVGGTVQTDTVAVPFLIGPKVANPKLTKTSPSEAAVNSPSQRAYAIGLRNEGNTPVLTYTLTDTIPSNFRLEGIARPSNGWDPDLDPDNIVTPTLTFYTSSGTCPSGGDVTFSGYPCAIPVSNGSNYFRAYNDNPYPENNPYSSYTLLNLPGAETITQVVWEWESLPVGYDNAGANTLFGQFVSPGRDSSVMTVGEWITNAITSTASNAAVLTATAQTLVVDPNPLPQLSKSVLSGSPTGPLGEVRFQVKLTNNDAALDPISGPVIADLLPAELDFGGMEPWMNNGSQSSSGPYQNSGLGAGSAIVSAALTAPTVLVTANYSGTGRTLVRYTWPNTVTVAPQHSFVVNFTTTVKAGTAPGAYHNEAVYFPKPADDARLCNSPVVTDVYDLDGDSDFSETLCGNSGGATAVPYVVITLAVMESRKFVKGQLDTDWSGDPIVGRTVQGGDIEYRFIVKNAGNVPLNRIQVVDVLPFVGDVGERTQTPRGSAWAVEWNGPLVVTPTISARTPITDPSAVSPITITAPITIYYSNSQKPCTDSANLPNLFGTNAPPQPVGCSAPGWTTTWSSDAKSFKVEFDPTVVLTGLNQVNFDILTKAPLYAPGATRGVDGEFGNNDDGNVAWNTFGFGGQRVDDDSYLAAQPPRVGIEVESLGLGDYVWFDIDHDGVQDAGEPGIPNVTVNLYEADGDYIRSTTTDSNGYYQFNGLLDGQDYYATFQPQMGTGLTLPGGLNITLDSSMTWTLPLQNSNTFSDSNVLTQTGTLGHSNLVSVTTAITETPAGIPDIVQAEHYTPTLDGGIWMPLRIGNRVWYDINANGLQDFGETSISGVVVTLTLASGAQMTATTDASGEYYFTNDSTVTVGANRVFTDAILYGDAFTLTVDPAQVTLAGYVLTQQNGGGVISNSASGDDTDSDAAVLGGMHVIIDRFGRAGATNYSYDFGYYTTVALGNRVWFDTNNNGIADIGEQNVPGVAMALYRDTNTDGVYSSGDTLISTTQTSADGYYTFTQLAPSYNQATSYMVVIVASNFQSGGALENYRNSTATTVPSINGANNNRDHGFEIGAMGSASGVVASAPFRLEAEVQPRTEGNEGNDPTGDDNSNQTIDFGFYKLVLGNRIWEDLNNDGDVDAGEPALDNVTVQLLDNSDSVISTTNTNAQGFYTFTSLASGTYRIVLPAGNFTGAGRLVGMTSSTGVNGDVGPYEPGIAEDNTLGGEDRDHGSVFGTLGQSGVVRSAQFALIPGSEPTVVTATATSTQPTLDFGLFIPAEVGNYVWYDRNHDGVQDNAAGETGVPGITVTLLQNSGVVSTTFTDSTGHYSFTNLVSGTGYTVRFELPGTLTLTVGSPANPDADATDSDVTEGGHTGETDAFTLGYGEKEPDIDAGVYDPASLGDTIWFDDNGNGQQDIGEDGVPAITATLFVSDALGNTWVQSVTQATNNAGYYEFAGLLPGTYYVSFTLPPGLPYTWTLALTGPVTTDSNVDRVTGATAPVTLLAGDHNPTIDGGINVFASLGNFVWDDLNHNGLQDSGEPGMPGITVTLFSGVTQVAQMQTNASGYYTFSGLISATYSVVFDLSPGYTFTRQITSSVDTDLLSSDQDSNVTDVGAGSTNAIALAWNTVNPNIDAGIWRPLSLGNRVWFDTNNDGIDNDGAAGALGTGVPGVTMVLYRDTNDDNSVTLGVDELYSTTLTDVGGYYTFTGLISGTYIVIIPAGNFTDTGVLVSYLNSTPTVSGDSDLNQRDHGSPIPAVVPGIGGSVASGPFTMVYASEPVNDGDASVHTNLSIDFGFYRLTLGNLVWEDLNNNGNVDVLEPVVPNVLVTLYDVTGATVLMTTTTDASGYYTFTGLFSDTYVVGLMPPAGYIGSTGAGQESDPELNGDDNDNGITTQPSGEIRSNAVTLTPADEPNVNSATGTTQNPTVDFGIWRPASLGNYVWIDADRDGVQNKPALSGLNGVTVTLYLQQPDESWSQLAVTQTANNPVGSNPGYYSFTHLIQGRYYVEFTLPNGYTWTTQAGSVDDPANSDADRDLGTSGPVYLNAGEHNPNIDAGVYLVNLSLGNRVWFDTNNDGLDNDGPASSLGTGVSDVSVELYADTDSNGSYSPGVDTLLGMTTTNASGYYTFTDLRAGAYVVVLPASNFNAGGPLESYRSSSPTSLDPNNDVNRDDNGIEIGGIVASRAVALSLYGEPVDDDAPASDPFADGDSNSNYSIDFGFYRLILGNVVWNDVDNNGLFDPTEAPIPGVTVNLYNISGTLIATMPTDAGGVYTFTGLAAGSYTVGVVPPPTFAGSSGPGQENDPNLNGDDNDNGVVAQPNGEIRSGAVVLTPGSVGGQANNTVDDATATTTDPTVDFGIWQPASLGNYVWRDANRDGVQNEAPVYGMNGVTVTLYISVTGNWQVFSVTRTSPDPLGNPGYYTFTNLVSGTYQVAVDLASLPPASTISPRDVPTGGDGADSDFDPVTGQSAPIVIVTGDRVPTIDMGVIMPAGLGDYVWLDIDHDGVQDVGESPVPGVPVTLFANGVPVSTTTTNDVGYYQFVLLTSGVPYSVSFGLPSGYTWTLQNTGTISNDSDVGIATGASGVVVLQPGEFNPTLDAGIWRPTIVTVEKLTLNPGFVRNNQTIGYQIIVRNIGDTLAQGVVITDPIPAGTRYVDGSATPAATLAGNSLVWSGLNIAPGGSVMVSFQATTIPGSVLVIRNMATVLNPGQGVDLSSNVVTNPFNPTAVTLDSFSAKLSERGVVVSWRTALEQNALGFHVLRSNTASRADAVRVSTELIVARGVSGASYEFVDPNGGATARYWIEEIELNGQSNVYGPALVTIVPLAVVAPVEAIGVSGGVPVASANGVAIAPLGVAQGGNGAVSVVPGNVIPVAPGSAASGVLPQPSQSNPSQEALASAVEAVRDSAAAQPADAATSAKSVPVSEQAAVSEPSAAVATDADGARVDAQVTAPEAGARASDARSAALRNIAVAAGAASLLLALGCAGVLVIVRRRRK